MDQKRFSLQSSLALIVNLTDCFWSTSLFIHTVVCLELSSGCPQNYKIPIISEPQYSCIRLNSVEPVTQENMETSHTLLFCKVLMLHFVLSVQQDTIIHVFFVVVFASKQQHFLSCVSLRCYKSHELPTTVQKSHTFGSWRVLNSYPDVDAVGLHITHCLKYNF